MERRDRPSGWRFDCRLGAQRDAQPCGEAVQPGRHFAGIRVTQHHDERREIERRYQHPWRHASILNSRRSGPAGVSSGMPCRVVLPSAACHQSRGQVGRRTRLARTNTPLPKIMPQRGAYTNDATPRFGFTQAREPRQDLRFVACAARVWLAIVLAFDITGLQHPAAAASWSGIRHDPSPIVQDADTRWRQRREPLSVLHEAATAAPRRTGTRSTECLR